MTAKEIYRALKHNEHQSERMIVFFREIEDIDLLDSTIKKKFIDSNTEAQNLFDQTKMDIRNALSQANVYTYSVCACVSSCIDELLLLYSIIFRSNGTTVQAKRSIWIHSKTILFKLSNVKSTIICVNVNQRMFCLMRF